MKLMIAVLFLIQTSLAHTIKQAQQTQSNLVLEGLCLKEIRKLNCGSPDDHKAFITCLDFKFDELSDKCQDFHLAELEKIKNRGI